MALQQALLLLLFAWPALGASRYSPPRKGLVVNKDSAPPGLYEALAYPCEDDASATCHGMKHSEALFGVPKYGGELKGAVYEAPTANDPAGSGCGKAIEADASWVKPFILLVNRGECHFTEKVRDAGAWRRRGTMLLLCRVLLFLLFSPFSSRALSARSFLKQKTCWN